MTTNATNATVEKTNELYGADDPRFGSGNYDNSHVPTDPRVRRARERRHAQRVTIRMPRWTAIVCVAVLLAFLVFVISAFLIRVSH